MISTRQIDAVGLTNFIEASISGTAFSGILVAYVGASGWLGNHVVYSSGGSQVLLGSYTFTNPITIPYAGASGQSISKKYVDDVFASVNTNLSGWAMGYFVNLSLDQLISGTKNFTGAVGVNLATTSGQAVQWFQATGISGALQTAMGNISNLVYQTGDQTIQGFKLFTGSPWVHDPTQPSGVVNLEYLSGVSGVLAAAGGGVGTGYSGYVENTFVHRGTIDETISGFKIFTGSPWVANPIQPSGVVNLYTLSGVSGILNAFIVSVSGGISGIQGPSGASGASGASIVGPQGPAGSGISLINSGTITGNFFTSSFYMDPVGTGLNLFESFVSNAFYFTGAAFSCRTSGAGPTNGGILSGVIYQVNQLNVETPLYTFTFNSGVIYSGSPLFASLVTGNNRVGLSITNSLSGIQKFCVGVFGGNYV